MKHLLLLAALLVSSTGLFAQEFMSTDGQSRKRRPQPGKKAIARVQMYFDVSEVPKEAHRAGLIVITKTNKREKAFVQAKDEAASFHCEGILLIQSKDKGAVTMYSNVTAAYKDSWVFYAYDLPEAEEEKSN